MTHRPKNVKSPYRGRLYTCAEDLCDPYESADLDAGGETFAPPKPRAHAVRLTDAMAEDGDSDVGGRRASTSRRMPTPAPCGASVPSLPSKRESETEEIGDAVCRILSIRPSGEGETVSVVLALPADMDPTAAGTPSRGTEAQRGGTQRLKLHLLVEQYADMHPREGNISREDAAALLEAGHFCAAVMRGMRLLAYGDRSAKRLAFQLTSKGIDRENADRAAAYLMQKGFIREDDTARMRAEGNLRKLWGPRRIREDLRANGFSPDAVREAMEALSEVDFVSNCAALIRKKCRELPTGRGEQQKLIAALMRLGYDMDTIRAAMHGVGREGK